MKKIFILLAVVSFFGIRAQNYGRIIITGKVDQSFLISFNGVRWSNDYSSKVVLEYAEDTDYKVRIWFPRNQNPINFNITSSPGYETVYVLERDQYDAYALTLESKVKFTAIPATPPVPPQLTISATPAAVITQTVAVTPTVPVIKEMDDVDFASRLNAVKKESFDDGKLKKAKFIFNDQYFSSMQAATVTSQFGFDSKKLEFAKYAYKKTIDKKNYYKVVDVLTFSSYKRDLENWIKKNP